MKQLAAIAFMICYFFAQGQNVLPKANVIVVKGVGFKQVCNALLDSGYIIERKDNDLQTARTEHKMYPKYWDATYSIDIRVKDSVAYFTAKFTSPSDGKGLFKDEPVYNLVNGKGVTHSKSLVAYPFTLIQRFTQGFGKPVEYLKK